MSSTPLTCCSIGAAIDSATTLASAPGYWHMTWIVGGVICGYCAIGSVKTAMPPVSVMTIDNTLAKIGRSMKKRENKSGWSSGAGGSLARLLKKANSYERIAVS